MLILDRPARRPGANSESYSAVGHHALVAVLKQSGLAVFRGHHLFYLRTRGKAIVFIEPKLDKWNRYIHNEFDDSLRQLLRTNNTVIVVCPKWMVQRRHSENPHWVGNCELLTSDSINSWLRQLRLPIKIAHQRQSNIQASLYASNRHYPITSTPLQYFIPGNRPIKPLITTKSGQILACCLHYFENLSGDLILISDPDLLNNKGLGLANNGRLILSLFHDQLAGKQIWIDEIGHGLGYPQSLLRTLLTYPVNCLTLQVLLAGCCLAWLVGIRFRPPLPAPRRSRSLEEQVKAFANITCSGRQHNYFLQKYLRSVLQEMSEHYPAITAMPLKGKLEYLTDIEKTRKVNYSITTLYRRSCKARNPRNITLIAKGIHRWKEQMISYRKSGL